MATTVTIDNITNIGCMRMEAAFGNIRGKIVVVGGRAQSHAIGSDEPVFNFSGEIRESTTAAALTKARQLQELFDNVEGYPFHYIQFAANESIHDGWYELDGQIRWRRDRDTYYSHPFDMTLVCKGTLGSHRLATWWTAPTTTETYSWGGATLAAKKLVALPNGVATTDPAYTVLETRTTSDGTVKVIEDPSQGTLFYKSNATIANWFKSGCKVYDHMGTADESFWVQVFDKSHVFTGNVVIQNGLLRYFYVSGVNSVLDVWDGTSWLGNYFNFDSTNWESKSAVELVTISPDKIEWRDVSVPAASLKATYSMKRGAYHMRVQLAVATANLTSAGGVVWRPVASQLFNASANGAAGGGDLATDASNNYHCGYHTSEDVVRGFVLLDKPSFQPDDVAIDYIMLSLPFTAPQTRTFFLFGFPQETDPFVIATGRTAAAKVARECMYDVEQKLILVPKGYYP